MDIFSTISMPNKHALHIRIRLLYSRYRKLKKVKTNVFLKHVHSVNFESYANHPSGNIGCFRIDVYTYNIGRSIFISTFVNFHMRANKHFNQNICLDRHSKSIFHIFYIHHQEILFPQQNISPLKPSNWSSTILWETTFLLNKNSILVYYRKMSVKLHRHFHFYHLHTPTITYKIQCKPNVEIICGWRFATQSSWEYPLFISYTMNGRISMI